MCCLLGTRHNLENLEDIEEPTEPRESRKSNGREPDYSMRIEAPIGVSIDWLIRLIKFDCLCLSKGSLLRWIRRGCLIAYELHRIIEFPTADTLDILRDF